MFIKYKGKTYPIILEKNAVIGKWYAIVEDAPDEISGMLALGEDQMHAVETLQEKINSMQKQDHIRRFGLPSAGGKESYGS